MIGLLFLLPAIIFISLFFLYPFLFNVLLGFQKTTVRSFVTQTSPFVGFDNYILLFKSSLFWRAFRNTLVFTVGSLSFQFTLGFLLSLLFFRHFPLSQLLRGLILIPWVTPLMVSANAFKWFLSEKGLINSSLLSLNLIQDPIGWLTQPGLVIWSLTAINIWLGIPFVFTLLHTGMTNIPAELYEAASIDGANGIQKVIYITLPVLKPVIMSCLMLGTVYTVKHFDIIWITTQGGPANASQVLSSLSYKYAFQQHQFSRGAVVANVMVIFVLILTYLYSRVKIDD